MSLIWEWELTKYLQQISYSMINIRPILFKVEKVKDAHYDWLYPTLYWKTLLTVKTRKKWYELQMNSEIVIIHGWFNEIDNPREL